MPLLTRRAAPDISGSLRLNMPLADAVESHAPGVLTCRSRGPYAIRQNGGKHVRATTINRTLEEQSRPRQDRYGQNDSLAEG